MPRLVFGLALFLTLSVLTTAAIACGDDDDKADVKPEKEAAFIPVTGEGKVTGQPDVAVLSLSMTALTDDVSGAFEGVQGATQKVMDFLKTAGVNEKDIQTTGFSISPESQYNPQTGVSTPLGIRVTNSLTVKMRDLTKVGATVNEIVTLGGSLVQFGGVSFAIDDPAPLQQQARDKALVDAKAKAAQMAAGLGLTLGQPVFAAEGSFDVFRLCGRTNEPSLGQSTFARPQTGGGDEAGFAAGTLEIAATIQVCYAAE
jgi:uncharacterized protein YggE